MVMNANTHTHHVIILNLHGKRRSSTQDFYLYVGKFVEGFCIGESIRIFCFKNNNQIKKKRVCDAEIL